MKKLWMVLALWGALAVQLHAQWKPVEGRISTQWSEQVNPDNVLPEYPRPIMERTEWKNLNGLWDYAIIEKGKHTPSVFDGKILGLTFLLLGKGKEFFCISEQSTGKLMYG